MEPPCSTSGIRLGSNKKTWYAGRHGLQESSKQRKEGSTDHCNPKEARRGTGIAVFTFAERDRGKAAGEDSMESCTRKDGTAPGQVADSSTTLGIM